MSEIKENNAEALMLFLKKISPGGSNTNVEIIIKSKTVKKTETGYECNSKDYEDFYNKIESFDEYGFKIIALGYPLDIIYEKLDYWMPCKRSGDKSNPNKINLCLKKEAVIVLYPGEKLELENI